MIGVTSLNRSLTLSEQSFTHQILRSLQDLVATAHHDPPGTFVGIFNHEFLGASCDLALRRDIATFLTRAIEQVHIRQAAGSGVRHNPDAPFGEPSRERPVAFTRCMWAGAGKLRGFERS